MLGLFHARLFVLGKEENVIKSKEEGREDSRYFKITLGDGGQNVFSVTCGSRSWEVEVEPNKKVIFDPYSLSFGQQYDMTFNIDSSQGYNKLRLRTWKAVGSMSNSHSSDASKSVK